MPAQFFGAQGAVTILNRAFANTSPSFLANANQVSNATAAGLEPGLSADNHLAYRNFALSFGRDYAHKTEAELSTLLLTNMGVLPSTVPEVVALEKAVADYIAGPIGGGKANIGYIALQLGAILSDLEANSIYGAAAKAWNNEINTAAAYSLNSANTNPFVGDVAQPSPNQGQTFTLTVDQNSGAAFAGGAGDDTYNGLATQNGAGALINTLQNVDVLDGGAGNDVLNATLSEAATVTPSVKNIETVNLRFVDAKAKLDLSGSTGVTTVAVADSTTAGAVDKVGAAATLSVKNQNQNVAFDSSTATTLAVNLDTVGEFTTPTQIWVDLGATVASKATTLNVTANNANAEIKDTKAPGIILTTTVAATGKNELKLTEAATKSTTVTVTGTGSADLLGAAFKGALTKFDASANEGGVKADIQSSKAAVVTGGKGADVAKMDTAVIGGTSVDLGAGNDALYTGALLGSFDKGANGGEGTDIISIIDGSKLDATTAKYITNFETLDVSGSKSGNYDVSLNSFATVQIDEVIAGVLAADVDFKNAPDTFALTIASKAKDADFDVTKNITVTGKDYTGTTAKGTAESFTLIANLNDGDKDNVAEGNINAQTVTVAGVENLTIQATTTTLDGGTDALKASKSTLTAKVVATEAETLTIKGDASVDLSSVATIGKVAKVDSTGSTGNVTIDFSKQGNSVNYFGGDGVDTYKGSAKGDSIFTGKGADAVTLAAAGARDVVIYKTGAESQVVDTSKDGKIVLGAAGKFDGKGVDLGFDTITTFDGKADATGDRLDLTNFGFTGSQRGVVDVSASVNGDTNVSSITGLFNSPAGNRGVAFATDATDGVVFVDANKDGNFTAADDLVVRLVGVTSLSESAINF